MAAFVTTEKERHTAYLRENPGLVPELARVLANTHILKLRTHAFRRTLPDYCRALFSPFFEICEQDLKAGVASIVQQFERLGLQAPASRRKFLEAYGEITGIADLDAGVHAVCVDAMVAQLQEDHRRATLRIQQCLRECHRISDVELENQLVARLKAHIEALNKIETLLAE
jgi:hypothetical protein